MASVNCAVFIRPGESAEALLKRFDRAFMKTKIRAECQRRAFAVGKGEARRAKQRLAEHRRRTRARRAEKLAQQRGGQRR